MYSLLYVGTANHLTVNSWERIRKRSGQGAALTKGTDSSHISQSVGFAYNMTVCLCGRHKGHLYFNTLMD